MINLLSAENRAILMILQLSGRKKSNFKKVSISISRDLLIGNNQ